MASNKGMSSDEMIKSVDEKVEKARAGLKACLMEYVGMNTKLVECIRSSKDARAQVQAQAAQAKEILVTAEKKKEEAEKESKENEVCQKQLQEKERYLHDRERKVQDREKQVAQQESRAKENENKFAKYEEEKMAFFKKETNRIAKEAEALENRKKQLEMKEKNNNEMEAKLRNTSMKLNLRETDCREKEACLAKKEAAFAAEEGAKSLERLKESRIMSEKTETKMKQLEAELTSRVTLLEKKLKESKAREEQLAEKLAECQDISANADMHYYGNEASTVMVGSLSLDSELPSKLSSKWIPIQEFVGIMRDDVDPKYLVMMQKLLSLLQNHAFVRRPKMSFEVGFLQNDGSVDPFVYGGAQTTEVAVRNVISELKKKIKALRDRGSKRTTSPSSEASFRM